MKNIILLLTFFFLAVLPKVSAQDAYADQIRKYINKYYPLAIHEQQEYGIPASITLAQGIHETDAGNSELMTKANNHFGIKCKSDWKGDTFIHSDNVPDECFKKYGSAEESYRDHSEHLKKNPRYASLFAISVTDYAGWAVGLHTCGYATNPQYSIKLIQLIEDYRLQQYTYMAIEGTNAKNYPAATSAPIIVKNTKHAPENEKSDSLRHVVDSLRAMMVARQATEKSKTGMEHIKDSPVQPTELPTHHDESKKEETEVSGDMAFDSGKVVTINGLRAFYAYKDEMLLKYAVKYKVRYARLLELNDLPDAPLPDNMPVYLEKKLFSGAHSKHTVKKGENMLMISQLEGIQIKRLYSLNLMEAGEEPAAGAVLELQSIAESKPALLNGRKKGLPKTEEKPEKKEAPTDYVAVTHPKPVVKDTPRENLVEVVPAKQTARKSAPVMKEDTSTEDLSGLKAELDRVVYADNSKLKSAPKPKPAPKKEDAEDEAPSSRQTATHDVKPVKKDAKNKEQTYVIKKGDTLNRIAEKFHVSIRQLQEWNHIKGANIRDGKTIRVQ